MGRPRDRYTVGLQPGRHRLGPHIHRPRLAHDSWRRFLLLWPAAPQERVVDDMAVHDDSRRRLVPVVLLGLLPRVQ